MRLKYKPLNLPSELVDELRIWRQAYSICYGVAEVSYGKMIRSMLDSLDETEPDVMAEMDRLLEKHPEYEKIVGSYREGIAKNSGYELKKVELIAEESHGSKTITEEAYNKMRNRLNDPALLSNEFLLKYYGMSNSDILPENKKSEFEFKRKSLESVFSLCNKESCYKQAIALLQSFDSPRMNSWDSQVADTPK